MVFVIRNSDQTIKTWCERGDDIVLAPGETVDVLPLSFTAYSARLRLSVNEVSGQIIRLPFSSTPVNVKVDVSCPGEEFVDLLIDRNTQRIALVDGKAELEVALTKPESTCLIGPADLTKYAAAGESCLSIKRSPG